VYKEFDGSQCQFVSFFFLLPPHPLLTPFLFTVSLRSQLRGSNAPSPIEDRRPYYVDGSGRPLRQFTDRTRSGSVGTNRTPTLPMPNIYTHASSDSSSSLLKYPPAATHQEGGPRRHHAEEDIEASAGNNNNAPASPPRVTYGHDEKFALFGQV
jgi:hypothetical protein